MNVDAIAINLGIPRHRLEEYLAGCSVVRQVGSGIFVSRDGILHIHAPERGLGGRKLVSEVDSALCEMFELSDVLRCPARKDNARVQRFIGRFGFVRYAETDTHFWYAAERKEKP